MKLFLKNLLSNKEHNARVQHFWRRRILLARPLLKEAGIGSILLENPYCILDAITSDMFILLTFSSSIVYDLTLGFIFLNAHLRRTTQAQSSSVSNFSHCLVSSINTQ
jgi:hypothetical protein